MKYAVIEAGLQRALADSESHGDAHVRGAANSGSYDGAELRPFAGRPGAMDAFTFPSRMGKRLHYRDGSVRVVTATMTHLCHPAPKEARNG